MTGIQDLPLAAQDALQLFCDGPISPRAVADAARRAGSKHGPAPIPTSPDELREEIALTERALDGAWHDFQRMTGKPAGIQHDYAVRHQATSDRLDALRDALDAVEKTNGEFDDA